MVQATKSGNFKAVPLPEAQTAVARCYSLIEIGTIPAFFNNKPQGLKKKLYVTWEFPNLKAVFNEEKGEEPFVIGMEMTSSTNDQSALYKLIGEWRNRLLTPEEQESFDINIMVGKPAMISFVHNRKKNFINAQITEITNENTAMKFNGIMQKPKEIVCPPMLNPQMIWDWAVDGNPFNAEKFMKIPRWLRDKMSLSEEFKQFGHDPEANQQTAGPTGTGQAAPPQQQTGAQPTQPAQPAPPVDEDGW